MTSTEQLSSTIPEQLLFIATYLLVPIYIENISIYLLTDGERPISFRDKFHGKSKFSLLHGNNLRAYELKNKYRCAYTSVFGFMKNGLDEKINDFFFALLIFCCFFF